MHVEIYEKLAQHLDDLPAGLPRTDSGVEMRILLKSKLDRFLAAN